MGKNGNWNSRLKKLGKEEQTKLTASSRKEVSEMRVKSVKLSREDH